MARASTAVAVQKAKITLPANINEQLAQEVANLQKRISAPSGDRITVTQGKKLKLPNGIEVTDLEAVVIDFVAANYYYTDTFDRNNIIPPACFALGLEPSGLEPSAKSPDKQGEACASCWANQWGSDPKGGKGKACSNARLLAVIPTEPDADGEYPMYVLKASATAIKHFDAHAAKVAQTFAKPVRAVVTHITVDQDSDWASLRFGILKPTDKDLFAYAQSRLEAAKERLLTEPDVTQSEETPKSVAKKQPATKKPVRKTH